VVAACVTIHHFKPPQRRAAELPPPIQMCDALSRNRPEELQTILVNCLLIGDDFFQEVQMVNLCPLPASWHKDAPRLSARR
jgi:hypothetical protein